MGKGKQALIAFEEVGEFTWATVQSASVLDAVNVAQFGQELLDYVGRMGGVRLLLDFKNVSYLSSAVLSELIRVKEALDRSQGALRLCGLSPDIRKVFEITNLDKVFIIYEGREHLLERFRRSLEVEAEDKGWPGFRSE